MAGTLQGENARVARTVQIFVRWGCAEALLQALRARMCLKRPSFPDEISSNESLVTLMQG